VGEPKRLSSGMGLAISLQKGIGDPRSLCSELQRTARCFEMSCLHASLAASAPKQSVFM